MASDPLRAEETRAWLDRAHADLRAATVDLGAESPRPEDAAFHCQQAAERALKGFLAWHDVPFRKTHSIEELGEQCLRLDERLRAVVDPAVPLTEFAWRFRYPGESQPLDLVEAEETVAVARAWYDAVLALLPEDARP
jgi:HEPN domain-containing protein